MIGLLFIDDKVACSFCGRMYRSRRGDLLSINRVKFAFAKMSYSVTFASRLAHTSAVGNGHVPTFG